MDQIIEEAARAIATVRDFCGDERGVAAEVFRDYGETMSFDRFMEAKRRADEIWAESQKAAGVKPAYWRRA